jgi:hypothetical protein
MSAHVIRDSLKWRTKEVAATDALHAAAPALLAVLGELRAAGGISAAPRDVRVSLGRAVRNLKDLWPAGCLLASLLPAPEARALGADVVDAEETSGRRPEDEADEGEAVAAVSPELCVSADSSEGNNDGADSSVLRRVEVCRELAAAVEAFGLADCWQWKPVLDGKRVMQAAGMKQGGPALGLLMSKVSDWQLANPKGGVEECLEWLRVEAKGEGQA